MTPTQVGVRPSAEDDLSEALEGHTESDVSDLTAPENTTERALADKLFETYVPIRDANGDIYGVVEVYRDYGVIQAEIDRLTRTLSISFGIGLLALWMLLLPVMVGVTRRLRRQNDQLSEQAEQLESHLEREQATVAELRELDRLKSDFVAAASHELRTPLTSIRGYANLLRDPGTAHETTLEAVDAIERQTSRMLRLVTNLLRESRIESEGVITGPVLFDVASLVEEVVADFHSDGRRFTMALQADLPTVRCDRGKVGDILTNLADNALKYSPAGSPIELGASLGGRGARPVGGRPRTGDRPRGRAAHLRPFLSSRPDGDPPSWRRRPGAAHRARVGGLAGWLDPCGPDAGRRRDLHVHGPARGGGARRGCAAPRGHPELHLHLLTPDWRRVRLLVYRSHEGSSRHSSCTGAVPSRLAPEADGQAQRTKPATAEEGGNASGNRKREVVQPGEGLRLHHPG